MSESQYDIAIVGGGLAGGLLALALRKQRPDLNLRIVESGKALGGSHLWSFFASDIAAADRWLVAPLISYGWARHSVAFPGHARTLKAPYYSIESERLDRVVRAAMPAGGVMTGRKVLGASARAVVLADGDRVAVGSTAGRPNLLVPGCRSTSRAGEQAYRWRAPVSGTYVFDTFGSSFDTALYVLDGCPGAELACNDDTRGESSPRSRSR